MRSLVRALFVVGPLALLVLSPGALGQEEPPPYEAPARYADRVSHSRLAAEGGDEKTEAAVKAGLDWLARHQTKDGFWDADGMSEACEGEKCDGPGYALYDTGVTGLALLALLADGHTFKQGEHRGVVLKSVKYLKMIQDPEGCFGPRTSAHYVYNHAIATLAWLEVYALTGSKLFRESGEMAVDFIRKSQNPDSGWRYGVRPGDSDSSVTGWMLAALYAAKELGFEVDRGDFVGAQKFLDGVTDPETGQVGYVRKGTGSDRPESVMDEFPAENSASLTALGLFSRLLTAKSPKRVQSLKKMREGKKLCLSLLPRWEKKHVDMYYWYYGSMALFQLGGKGWKEWNAALKGALLPHQETEGCAKGSWDPAGPWGRDGGRVYSTALCTLMLQTYYRYGRLE